MQLTTKESETKSRIDEIERIEYFAKSKVLTIYFNVCKEISGDESDRIFDIKNPLTMSIELVPEAMQIICQKALELRATQLAATIANIEIESDYKSFYGELLTTELFVITRYKADQNLQVNTAYTDFALALTNCIIGNENAIALQFCLNKMIEVLGDSIQLSQLEYLDDLIVKYKLPIARVVETIG